MERQANNTNQGVARTAIDGFASDREEVAFTLDQRFFDAFDAMG